MKAFHNIAEKISIKPNHKKDIYLKIYICIMFRLS